MPARREPRWIERADNIEEVARDSFPSKVVVVLAKRAAARCSLCKLATSGPGQDPGASVTIGVAAHIKGASPGGPRYDGAMTPTQRKGVKNGIWLCQNHAKEIDDDASRYTVPYLEQLKEAHEADIAAEIRSGTRANVDDDRILAALEVVLDRPALYEPFANCRNAYFGKAVSDVVEALNTGVHRLRDGTEIQRVPSRHQLKGKKAGEALAGIVDTLGDLRALHASLVERALINDGCGCAKNAEASAPLDELRRKIIAFHTVRPTFARHVRSPSEPRRS